MIKKITAITLFFITISIFSQQEKINKHKYVIVPIQFKFLKSSDQYQTSSLTKFLLEKKGFTVFLSNEKLPNELISNRCLALTADVVDDSSLFTVKNKIELKDCFGTLLYSSKIGKSKSKEYKKGYHEAIRKAYDSMADLEYKYSPVKVEVEVKKDDIKTEIKPSIKKDAPVKVIPVVKEATPIKKIISTEINNNASLNIEILYAQVKTNGFQLVNTSPAIVFQILKTKAKNVFIIKDKNGIIYKSGKIWIAEFYENKKLIQKKYQIKF